MKPDQLRETERAVAPIVALVIMGTVTIFVTGLAAALLFGLF